MYCKKCGFNLNEEMSFCPKCGRNVDSLKSQKNNETNLQTKKNNSNETVDRDLWNKLISNVLKYHNFKVKGASLDKIKDAYHQAEKDLIKYNQFLKKQGKKIFPIDQNSRYPYDKSIEYIANKIIKNHQRKNVGQQYMRSFTDINELNHWLKNEKGIKNIKCDIQTGNSIGLVANHITLEKINVTYIKTMNDYPYRFQVTFIEKTNMLKAGGGKYIDTLKKLNPSKTIVSYVCKSSSRGSSSSVAFGFGLDYMEHESYFIVYREDISDNRSFIKK